MNIASDGSVFGTPDPALIAQTHERQTLFNTKMIAYRMKNGRPEISIHFRTKTHMPTVYMTAGMFPDLVNIEVMTRHFVIVSIPYRSDEDVERMRRHFTDVWQMTHFN
ncbi:hypothetical protein [Rhizobium sp. Leaf383]|uniref:hypothetical protein n=1 Tax=Rhizobium sp. Leaf383 TaxID=1736357 RepID=UPI000713D2DD|nr:hypothetical protein [Rhizobium sp. Leaf383]KQS84285.1 hypothetical protein ASG58_21175 [Rhizobium sp. Leaf383]